MANAPALDPGSAEVAQNLDHAATAEGMPNTGIEAIETEHGGIAPEAHAEPALLGVLDATVWVSIAMAVFIAILLWKKVPALIVGGLDKQIAAIRERLDEAKAIRAEAEALRDEYARKIASVEQQAAAMIAHADEEAAALLAKAESDAADLIRRRTRMAEDKIGAAERQAVADVRAKAANAAATAAAAIIAERHGADADRTLVDRTIAGLGRLN
ncbi:F0F1 ATP synthase subunit B [Sphingomonas japonica]|uniref:ATP synthase subunit b n=1 Tax=Sphingomonas japonica TaxID=511662 RepID=A0ABX0U4Z2_9SPHN|nr:F0F1 ATP synthase subunit B [Sphingomonas japonica]NIJ24382.1 F-type H+-transporting ATPase subunit b [Sphingomonas japonica]